MKTNFLLGVLLLLLTQACTTSQSIPPAAPNQSLYQDTELIKQSLFSDKDATLSEAAIQQLLDGHIKLPEAAKLAIYRFGNQSLNRYYSRWWYTEAYLKTQQSYMDTLINSLVQGERVDEVILMPQMMSPAQANITQLREAAVRLQADLLFVFTLSSDIYYKYKSLKRDEAKAFATCEAILLDIRTGVVPHTSVMTKEIYTKKLPGDLSVEEMRKRAEKEAVIAALIATGEKAASFLKQ